MNRPCNFRFQLFSLAGLLLLASCGNNAANNNQPNAATSAQNANNSATFSAAKGCKNIGVLLPESDSSARYEAYDRPLLEQEINEVDGKSPSSTRWG